MLFWGREKTGPWRHLLNSQGLRWQFSFFPPAETLLNCLWWDFNPLLSLFTCIYHVAFPLGALRIFSLSSVSRNSSLICCYCCCCCHCCLYICPVWGLLSLLDMKVDGFFFNKFENILAFISSNIFLIRSLSLFPVVSLILWYDFTNYWVSLHFPHPHLFLSLFFRADHFYQLSSRSITLSPTQIQQFPLICFQDHLILLLVALGVKPTECIF